MTAPEENCGCHSCNPDVCDPARPGHFIGAEDCRFFVHVGVGQYCVSTVGEWVSPGDDEEPQPIGYDRLYETMVFDKTRRRRWGNIDFRGYNTRADAQAGHQEFVERYTKKVNRKKAKGAA